MKYYYFAIIMVLLWYTSFEWSPLFGYYHGIIVLLLYILSQYMLLFSTLARVFSVLSSTVFLFSNPNFVNMFAQINVWSKHSILQGKLGVIPDADEHVTDSSVWSTLKLLYSNEMVLYGTFMTKW